MPGWGLSFGDGGWGCVSGLCFGPAFRACVSGLRFGPAFWACVSGLPVFRGLRAVFRFGAAFRACVSWVEGCVSRLRPVFRGLRAVFRSWGSVRILLREAPAFIPRGSPGDTHRPRWPVTAQRRLREAAWRCASAGTRESPCLETEEEQEEEEQQTQLAGLRPLRHSPFLLLCGTGWENSLRLTGLEVRSLFWAFPRADPPPFRHLHPRYTPPSYYNK